MAPLDRRQGAGLQDTRYTGLGSTSAIPSIAMGYVTIDEMRAEGVGQEFTDGHLAERISLAQHVIEQLTLRFFERREGLVVKFDGSGHDLLRLRIPPAGVDAITSVLIDGESIAQEDYELVINGFEDYRRYPRLQHLWSIWPKGKRNIELTGAFGYVEPDGSTPPMIKDACKRIVVKYLPEIADLDKQRADLIVQESLKDYSYRLSEASGRLSGWFQDPKIDNVIAMYRPLGISVV